MAVMPDSPTIYTRPEALEEFGRTSFLDPSTPAYNDSDWKTMAALQNGHQDVAHQHHHPTLFSPSETPQSMTSRSDSFQNGDSLHRHLLVETAMFDSSAYDVLSIEEVDSLKKEKTAVDARIEGTRRKLALESKVRDAAKSLHRLYSQKGRKASFSSNRESIGQANAELQESEAKVQDLVQMLVGLENRRQYVESRLLRHTAAVLQAAHLEREADHAHHLNPDSLPYIRDFDQSVHSDLGNHSMVDDAQLADVNARLQLLNGQMRSLISQAKKGRQGSHDHTPDDIPSAYPEDDDPATRMNNQLDHLQEHVFSLVQEHKRMSQSQQDMTDNSKHEQHVIEGRLGGVNSHLFSLISNSADRENVPELQPPPQVSGHGTQEQINYLEESLFNVEQMFNRSEQHQESHGTVMDLWGLLASHKTTQSTRDIDSDSEQDNTLTEPFSLQAFNTKVQHILSRSNNHESQIEILRRQIEQQRDLAGKAEADATEMQALKEREEETLEELETQRKRVEELEDQIVVLEHKISEHQDEARIAGIELEHKEGEHKELSESIASANTAKETAEADLAKKETEMQELESDIVRLTTELTMAKAELDGAYGSRSERARDLASHPEFQELEQKHRALLAKMEHLYSEKDTREQELQQTTGMHKEAEERALALEGEIMTLREIQATTTQGDGRMKALEKELADMATDYQELTRETVEMEKEREKLESVADGLRDKMELLEQQLSDEKVRWLGVRSPSGTPDMGAKETTSTMVLRNEFKKMMRETRAEGVKLLRAEQEQRRQIEGQLRAMRRDRNGGVSPRLGMPSPGLRPA